MYNEKGKSNSLGRIMRGHNAIFLIECTWIMRRRRRPRIDWSRDVKVKIDRAHYNTENLKGNGEKYTHTATSTLGWHYDDILLNVKQLVIYSDAFDSIRKFYEKV